MAWYGEKIATKQSGGGGSRPTQIYNLRKGIFNEQAGEVRFRILSGIHSFYRQFYKGEYQGRSVSRTAYAAKPGFIEAQHYPEGGLVTQVLVFTCWNYNHNAIEYWHVNSARATKDLQNIMMKAYDGQYPNEKWFDLVISYDGRQGRDATYAVTTYDLTPVAQVIDGKLVLQQYKMDDQTRSLLVQAVANERKLSGFSEIASKYDDTHISEAFDAFIDRMDVQKRQERQAAASQTVAQPQAAPQPVQQPVQQVVSQPVAQPAPVQPTPQPVAQPQVAPITEDEWATAVDEDMDIPF